MRTIFAALILAYTAHSATPTFGSLVVMVASQNSVTVTVTITGGISEQIQASTDGFATHIDTPWFPVAASAVAAQLQDSTTYSVRVVACDASMPAFPATDACSGNAGTSSASPAVTSIPIITYPTKWNVKVAAGWSGYSQVQFPLNSRYAYADTWTNTWMANGTIVMSYNDGYTPNQAITNSNVALTTVDSSFTNIQALNLLTGLGNQNTPNVPACYSDGSTSKGSSILAIDDASYPAANRGLYALWYRQNGAGYNQADGYIVRSNDGGSTWFNSTHNAGSSNANGDPACPGFGVTWTGTKFALPRFVIQGKQGEAISNPIQGIDAYRYITFFNNAQTDITMCRVYNQLDLQVAANQECYVGAVGGNVNLPANWSTTTSGATSITPIVTADATDFRIQYLPEFGRFASFSTSQPTATAANLVILGSASLTGPWLAEYWTGRPPNPPGPNSHSQYLEASWYHIFQPTYTVNSASPPSISIQLLNGGQYFEQYLVDPVNNYYSPFLLNVDVTTGPLVTGTKASGTVGGGGTIQ